MNNLPAGLPKQADAADRLCKGIKPTEKDQYIKDATVSGLVFRVTKAGKKVWQLRYSFKVAGQWKDKKTTIGSFDDGMGTKAARVQAETLRGQIHSGVDLVGEKKAAEQRELEALQQQTQERLSRVTMQDLFDSWLKNHLQKPKDGHKDGGEWAGGIIRHNVLTQFAELEAKRFGKAEFHKVTDPLLQAGNNRLANVVLSLTKQMLTFAVAREYIEANPLDNLKRSAVGGEDTERDRVLCRSEDPDTHEVVPDELGVLFERLPSSGLPDTSQAAVYICLSTCCRVGELLKARWSEVDLAAGEWRIPAENSKNGKPHLINLSDYALTHFHRLHEATGDTEWLYPSRRRSGAIDPKTVTKQVADRQRDEDSHLKGRTKKHDALNLPRGKWTPHDLRRTGATLMAELGVSDAIVERCLNHREQNRVKRTYNRYNPRPEMKRAWLLLGEELQRLSSDEQPEASKPEQASNVVAIGRR